MGKHYNKYYRDIKKWDKDILVSNCCGSEVEHERCCECGEGTTLITEKEFNKVDFDWEEYIWKIN